MKPDWDTLLGVYEGHMTILVGVVDCTTAGKPLCDSNGVKGFPTIKSGDPANMEDYSGGRDLTALRSHASALKPLCSPLNMDLCDDEQKAEIEAIQAMTTEELDAKIAAADAKVAEAEKTFDTELEKLQATYKKLQETKEATLAEVKASGIGLIKSVKAAKAASPAKEEL